MIYTGYQFSVKLNYIRLHQIYLVHIINTVSEIIGCQKVAHSLDRSALFLPDIIREVRIFKIFNDHPAAYAVTKVFQKCIRLLLPQTVIRK